jgi:hypothetical protein
MLFIDVCCLLFSVYLYFKTLDVRRYRTLKCGVVTPAITRHRRDARARGVVKTPAITRISQSDL